MSPQDPIFPSCHTPVTPLSHPYHSAFLAVVTPLSQPNWFHSSHPCRFARRFARRFAPICQTPVIFCMLFCIRYTFLELSGSRELLYKLNESQSQLSQLALEKDMAYNHLKTRCQAQIGALEVSLEKAATDAELMRGDMVARVEKAQEAAEGASWREAETMAALEAARREGDAMRREGDAMRIDAKRQADTARADVQRARAEAEVARAEAASAKRLGKAAKRELEASRAATEVAMRQAEAARAEADAAHNEAEAAIRQVDAANRRSQRREGFTTEGVTTISSREGSSTDSSKEALSTVASILCSELRVSEYELSREIRRREVAEALAAEALAVRDEVSSTDGFESEGEAGREAERQARLVANAVTSALLSGEAISPDALTPPQRSLFQQPYVPYREGEITWQVGNCFLILISHGFWKMVLTPCPVVTPRPILSPSLHTTRTFLPMCHLSMCHLSLLIFPMHAGWRIASALPPL